MNRAHLDTKLAFEFRFDALTVAVRSSPSYWPLMYLMLVCGHRTAEALLAPLDGGSAEGGEGLAGELVRAQRRVAASMSCRLSGRGPVIVRTANERTLSRSKLRVIRPRRRRYPKVVGCSCVSTGCACILQEPRRTGLVTGDAQLDRASAAGAVDVTRTHDGTRSATADSSA